MDVLTMINITKKHGINMEIKSIGTMANVNRIELTISRDQYSIRRTMTLEMLLSSNIDAMAELFVGMIVELGGKVNGA